ncbi:hypothetical protein LZ906_008390 [Paraclostridium ghonii]|uniref:hypothetical protein n=1 Tax=Paraclostridium ghonii TaxID=29358 RepID=UPI00202CF1A3|nr:hypothetical protein [Paeniclostridium ghonii]MCM0167172.1 hypothetical protein [Paeniclostridium ghonii]
MVFDAIILMVGILGVVLGVIIRKYNLGYLVSWVNSKKYDNNKVASIMGTHVIVSGLCLITIAGVDYILKNAYQNIIVITIILSCFAIEFGGYYRIFKYAKLEN